MPQRALNRAPRPPLKDVSYLITYRESGGVERRENLLAVLRWLRQWPDVETIIVEQDTVERLEPKLLAGAKICLAYNAGLFNRGWGMNVAARLARHPVLVVADADVIVSSTLPDAVETCRGAVAAVKPFRKAIDLTPEESARVRAGDWSLVPKRNGDASSGRGQAPEGKFPLRSLAGAVFASLLFVIQREHYLRIGGFDERFRGWGEEDDAMTIKLSRSQTRAAYIDGAPALHLWHPRSHQATFGQPHYEANLRLAAEYRNCSDTDFARMCEEQRRMMGDIGKYHPST